MKTIFITYLLFAGITLSPAASTQHEGTSESHELSTKTEGSTTLTTNPSTSYTNALDETLQEINRGGALPINSSTKEAIFQLNSTTNTNSSSGLSSVLYTGIDSIATAKKDMRKHNIVMRDITTEAETEISPIRQDPENHASVSTTQNTISSKLPSEIFSVMSHLEDQTTIAKTSKEESNSSYLSSLGPLSGQIRESLDDLQPNQTTITASKDNVLTSKEASNTLIKNQIFNTMPHSHTRSTDEINPTKTPSHNVQTTPEVITGEPEKASALPLTEVQTVKLSSENKDKDTTVPPNEDIKDTTVPPNEDIKDTTVPPNEDIKDTTVPPNEDIKDTTVPPNEDIKDTTVPPHYLDGFSVDGVSSSKIEATFPQTIFTNPTEPSTGLISTEIITTATANEDTASGKQDRGITTEQETFTTNHVIFPTTQPETTQATKPKTGTIKQSIKTETSKPPGKQNQKNASSPLETHDVRKNGNPGLIVACLITGTLVLMLIAIAMILVMKRRRMKNQLENSDWAGPSPFLESSIEPKMDASETLDQNKSKRISLHSFLPQQLSNRFTAIPEDELHMVDVTGCTFGKNEQDNVLPEDGKVEKNQTQKGQTDQNPPAQSPPSDLTETDNAPAAPVNSVQPTPPTNDEAIPSMPSEKNTVSPPLPSPHFEDVDLNPALAQTSESTSVPTPPAPPPP